MGNSLVYRKPWPFYLNLVPDFACSIRFSRKITDLANGSISQGILYIECTYTRRRVEGTTARFQRSSCELKRNWKTYPSLSLHLNIFGMPRKKTLEEQFENDCTSIAQGWRTRLYPWADFSPDQGSTTDHSKPKLKMGSQSCGKLPESSHGLWCLHTKDVPIHCGLICSRSLSFSGTWSCGWN